MSFSVEAREFVPASFSTRAPAQHGSAHAWKDRVCMSYFDCGECPFADNCKHAHNFCELNTATRTKLLATMPMEQLPRHFLKPNTTAAPGHRATQGRRRDPAVVGSNPSQRRLARLTVQQRLPLEMSVSSQTSSSTARSKPSSPMTAADDAAFKMRLPARCRYPHQNIPGTYYDALGVPVDASDEEIFSKYYAWRHEGYKRMRLIDPKGADSADRLIVEARNVLGRPFLRREYDRTVPGTVENAWSKGLGNGHDTSISQCGQTQGHSTTASSLGSDRLICGARPIQLSSSVASHASATSLSDDIW